jgi:hypothetical protein
VKPFALTPPRLVAAALIIGVATAGDLWVARYKTLTPLGRAWRYGSPPRVSPAALSNAQSSFFASPTWTAPVAALIGIAAIGAAVILLRRRYTKLSR